MTDKSANADDQDDAGVYQFKSEGANRVAEFLDGIDEYLNRQEAMGADGFKLATGHIAVFERHHNDDGKEAREGGPEDAGVKRVICPWCTTTYQSKEEWASEFPKKHPFLNRLDSAIPIFNTPSEVEHD